MMKRFILLIALLCVPWSAMAMKPLDDKTLEQISGQAGVSIMVDITMNIHIDVLAWGDSDGLGPEWGVTTKGGFVGVTDLNVTGLRFSPRTDIFSSDSVGFWPDSATINVVNGQPYLVVNVSPGRE